MEENEDYKCRSIKYTVFIIILGILIIISGIIIGGASGKFDIRAAMYVWIAGAISIVAFSIFNAILQTQEETRDILLDILDKNNCSNKQSNNNDNIEEDDDNKILKSLIEKYEK